jgi:hypothetical protein
MKKFDYPVKDSRGLRPSFDGENYGLSSAVMKKYEKGYKSRALLFPRDNLRPYLERIW